MKNKYFQQAIEDIVKLELFHTYTLDNKGNEIPTYVTEGYDKEKMEAEGSTWVVYVYACMSDYYQRNKKRIDKEVRKMLAS